MSERRVTGALALLAGTVACAGIVLVAPFASSVAGLWQGSSADHPAHDYLTAALGFGVPLALCIALAVLSLALRAERPGSAVPALLALSLIGIQLLVFLSFAAFASLSPGAS